MEYVVMYSIREGVERSQVIETYPRHQAYFEAFLCAAGGARAIALGPFETTDPAGASMGIFTSREDAERFIARDPFIVEALAVPRILEWNAVRFGQRVQPSRRGVLPLPSTRASDWPPAVCRRGATRPRPALRLEGGPWVRELPRAKGSLTPALRSVTSTWVPWGFRRP